MITKSLFTVCLFLSVLADCFSQTTDVLQLHKQKNFKEQNIFLISPNFEIVQIVAYNGNAIDGNYEMQLFLQVHKIDSLIENRTINITTGTEILSCFFDMQSTWNWEPEKADVEGVITVSKRTKNKITLLLDLTVTDKDRIYVYKGERTFAKSKMPRLRNWNNL